VRNRIVEQYLDQTPPTLLRPPPVQALAILEADQYADWVQRYGSNQNVFKNQQCLFVARDFGRIVGTASVAATPYGKLGRNGRSRAGRSAEEMKASKRDSSALVTQFGSPFALAL